MAIARSGATVTGIAGVADASLAGVGSPLVATVAVLTTLGSAPASTFTVSVTTAESPGTMGPGLVQVTVWPAFPQLQPVPLPDTKPSPVGKTSVIVIAVLVGPEPTLRAARRKVAARPTMKAPVDVFASDRSGAVFTGAFGADPVLLPAFGSPVAVTVARLPIVPMAEGETVVLMVRTPESPASSAVGRVQVTICELTPQVKPPPDANTNESAAFRVSLMTVAPVVAAEPMLRTVST